MDLRIPKLRDGSYFPSLLTKVPRSAQPWAATMVRSIYQQPSAEEVRMQLERVVDHLSDRFPDASSMLAEAGADVPAFTAFPGTCWKQVWSNNPQERLNKEIRRRTNVVGIFPNRDVGEMTLYIEPGSPWENGYIESFNGKLRDELLDGEVFYTMTDVKVLTAQYRQIYNQVRPHSSLGYRPPAPETILPTGSFPVQVPLT